MSDSEDSSDIDKMLSRVSSAKRKQRELAQADHDDEEYDDTDLDEDDVSPSRRRRRRGGRQSSSLAAKLARVEQKAAIDQRRRENLLNGVDKDDSDDSEREDNNDCGYEIEIVGESPVKKVSPKKKRQFLANDSSSDEEDTPAVAPPDNAALVGLQRAAEELARAQQYQAQESLSTQPSPIIANNANLAAALFSAAGMDVATVALMAAAVHQQQASVPRPLSVAVEVTLQHCDGTTPPTNQSVVLDIMTTSTLNDLQGILLAKLGLSPSTAVATLAINGQAMRAHHKTACEYGLVPSSRLSSLVLLTGLDMLSRKPKQQDLGRQITLTIRNIETQKETNVSVRTKETLKIVQTRYAEAEGMQGRSIELQFDGIAVNLTKTPEQYEMEDEDLLDVKVK